MVDSWSFTKQIVANVVTIGIVMLVLQRCSVRVERHVSLNKNTFTTTYRIGFS